MVDGAITTHDVVVNGGLTWINLERPSRDILEKEAVSRGYLFHDLNIEDCLSKSQVAPHGLTATLQDQVNADLLSFLKS
jgi:hypothetical protein